MKTISFSTIILIFLTASLRSQDCKTITDAFTNEKQKQFIYVDLGYVIGIKFISTKSGNSAEFTFSYGGVLEQHVPEGAEILLKLETGDIIKLVTKKESIPTPFKAGVIMTSYIYTVDISKETMTKLASNRVTNLRYPDPTKEFIDLNSDAKPWKKLFKNISDGAKCLTQ